MGKLKEILAKPEPERSAALIALDATSVVEVYAPKAFKVRFEGKLVNVSKGKNAFPARFAGWLMDEHSEVTDDAPGSGSKSDETTKE